MGATICLLLSIFEEESNSTIFTDRRISANQWRQSLRAVQNWRPIKVRFACSYKGLADSTVVWKHRQDRVNHWPHRQV
jgi:hypothetical protein